MKKIWIILLLLAVITSLLFWFYKSGVFKAEEEYIPTDYEQELIDYFNEIALKSEYFDSPEKVTKWRKTMALFVYKEGKQKEQMGIIHNTIQSINSISSDGFKIKIVDDFKDANAFMYLCKKEKVKDLAPKFYNILNDSINYDYSGFSYVEFKWTNFVIDKALMFINIDSPIEKQKHAIIEELTQSIGLSNDSDKYPESIFYDNEDIQNTNDFQYSKMDIALINFLYNPKMKPGFNNMTAELVIKKILKDENEAINR